MSVSCSCYRSCIYQNGFCQIEDVNTINGIKVCKRQQAVTEIIKFIEFWQRESDSILEYCKTNSDELSCLTARLINNFDAISMQDKAFADALYAFHSNRSIFDETAKKGEYVLSTCQEAYKTLKAMCEINDYIKTRRDKEE